MLVIVLCSPLEVYQASFWLSFSAVIIILQAAQPSQVNWLEEEALQKLAYNLRFLVPTCSWGSLVWLREHLQYVWRIQWGLFIGLLPLALYFFQQSTQAMDDTPAYHLDCEQAMNAWHWGALCHWPG